MQFPSAMQNKYSFCNHDAIMTFFYAVILINLYQIFKRIIFPLLNKSYFHVKILKKINFDFNSLNWNWKKRKGDRFLDDHFQCHLPRWRWQRRALKQFLRYQYFQYLDWMIVTIIIEKFVYEIWIFILVDFLWVWYNHEKHLCLHFLLQILHFPIFCK